MAEFQIALPLVTYEIAREVVHQRVRDGYVNATAMCKAAGREWSSYRRSADAFIAALEGSLQIRRDLLIQTITTGANELRGTWVHPQVAINLAQWLSPEFAVKVTQWVFDWMSGQIPGGNLPYHLRRYMANLTNVPNGHFSMLNEMTIALIAPLEQMGYVMPDTMVPDISEGRMFSKWLRENGHDPDSMPSYQHRYEDGRIVNARAYPIRVLPDFRRHFVEEWMHKRAIDYFGSRDTNAIPHLQNLLALPNYNDIVGFIEDRTNG
ncbi:KilA-N domain-containing protein [Sphingomonas changnyeongensis]|uniref:KilA-N domain-containing protein n=1 Tax=Sphingomonas changnyeongensis TaxID=2698679 RepID=A0A7Z2NY92_9SPHN|nr:KilA-N domain-containing protein [Sphingomonas changnyeongensis]QHL91629.1 KilA-N domain-containing protein [Sphingomonas changnyeongensis]